MNLYGGVPGLARYEHNMEQAELFMDAAVEWAAKNEPDLLDGGEPIDEDELVLAFSDWLDTPPEPELDRDEDYELERDYDSWLESRYEDRYDDGDY